MGPTWGRQGRSVKTRFRAQLQDCHNKIWTADVEAAEENNYYSDAIMSVVASQITESRLFVQPFVQAQIKGNIKAPCNWIVVMRIHRSPVDSPINRTVTRRKCLLLMTSSWSSFDQLGFYQFDQILILYYDTRHPMNNWLQHAKNKVVRKDLIWNIFIGKLRFFSNERHYTKTFHSALTLLICFAKRNLHPHWRILLSSMARSSRSCFLVNMLVSLVNACQINC